VALLRLAVGVPVRGGDQRGNGALYAEAVADVAWEEKQLKIQNEKLRIEDTGSSYRLPVSRSFSC
jgi:hypothetical protein